jgi:predicted Zn finger-like uncharacterized protein
MIKVECESCSAPYELDPRRIPDKGMKMRCPKCGTSFMVNKSGVVPAGAASSSTGATPPPPAPVGVQPPVPAVPKHTMLGHRSPGAPPLKEAVSVVPPPLAKGTVMGLAAPLPPPPKPAAAAGAFGVPPAPAAAALPLPPLSKPLSAPLAPPFPAAAPAPGPVPGGLFGTAAGAFGGAPQAAPAAAAVPPIAAPKRTVLGAAAPVAPPAPAAPAPSRDELADLSLSNMRFDDLPAPKQEVDLPSPRMQLPSLDDDDLPAFKPGAFPGRDLGPKGGGLFDAAAGAATPEPEPDAEFELGGDDDSGFEVDLPAPKATGATTKGFADLPAPKVASAAAPAAAAPRIAPAAKTGFEDLPAPKQAGHVDLPAPKPGHVDLPGPKGGFTDLPAPKQAGHVDLPAPKAGHVDLPGPKGGFTDLPAPKGGHVDLPAPKGGHVDLPAPKGFADLPAPKGFADLPAPKGFADLPAPKGGVVDLPTPRGLADLPAPKLDGGFGGLDLPAPRGLADLPAHKQDLDLPVRTGKAAPDESSFGDIELPDLPGGGGSDESSFADLELPPPKPSSNLIKPKERTALGMGSKKPDDESSFGSIGLDEDRMDSDLPPSLRADQDESSFGDLDLGEPEPSSPPPSRRGVPAVPNSLPPSLRTDDEMEELELPSYGLPPPRQNAGFMEPDEAYGDDAYGEDSFGEDRGGEAGFGEVEIGAGGGDSDDREFGIDDEAAYDEDGIALSPELLRRQRGEEFEAKQAALSKRAVNVVLRLAVVLVVLVGAGIAADFVTDYGYFGMYYFERYTEAGGDPKFVHAAVERAEQMAMTDSYPDVRRSLKELGDTRKKAGLNRELLTRSLVHESLYVVRFGDDPQAATRAAGILKRLEERKLVAPGIELALAADAARRKKWDEAAGKLARARAKSQNDPYVELLAGEIALKEGKPADAEKAFAKALQNGGGARAQWGVTRVVLLGDDVALKTAAVDETLKLSPLHVEARVERARLLWVQGRENKAHFELRQALGLDPVEEGRHLWTSESGLASGYSVLGYLHEARGRTHQARKAYDRALKADPFRAEALLGAGRTLLREKRADDALPRFEAAHNSATKGENPLVLSGRRAADEAQLGMGRALLALNRAQEAKDKLAALLSTNQQDAEVTRAVGRAEQALGNDEVAETYFRKAIELKPEEFDGYLALAQLFFKANKPDQASAVLNEAAARVEETSEMRRMLGESELARNRIESAIHEYQRALELDPSDNDAKFGLGRALRKNGQLEDAKALFETLGTAEDAMSGLEVEKGRVFEAEGEYKKAIASYASALEKEPDDVQLLLRLGAAQVEAGEVDEAEQTLQKVIRGMPNSAEAEYFIGRVAFARGRTPDAMTHFDRALTLDGQQAEFHLYAARAAFEMKNLGRTLEEIELTLNRDPTLADAYWVRGTVQVQMGAVQDALKDLKRAIKLKPSRYEAWAAIGECYDQLRDLPEAIKSFKTALAKEPDNSFWWYRVARIELDRGERTEGGNALKRAISLGDELDPMPYWLPDAYVLAGQLAEQNQNKQGAIFMYRRYMEIAPDGALDRYEVDKKLAAWNVKLTDDEDE